MLSVGLPNLCLIPQDGIHLRNILNYFFICVKLLFEQKFIHSFVIKFLMTPLKNLYTTYGYFGTRAQLLIYWQ